MVEITDERPGDSTAIEALLDEAFGSDRQRKISYRYRQRLQPIDGLCLVALDGAELVGTIRHWPITIETEAGNEPALLLGPVAVAASRRIQGIGARLIEAALARASTAGHQIIVLVGDQGYYEKFGFHLAGVHGIVMPAEKAERVQVLSLNGAILLPGTIRHAGTALADGRKSAA